MKTLTLAAWMLALGYAVPPMSAAQEGTVTGQVTRASDGVPMSGVTVSIRGTSLSAVTGTDGRYTLQRVPAGEQILLFRQFGQRPTERSVTIPPGGTVTFDVALVPQPITLGEVVVESASRLPERVVEAPAAVSVVDPVVVRDVSATGQTALVVKNIPGVDIVQSGINDFNINARGFNTTLNRRVLVLQDGRDLAVAFLGAQEWNAFAVPTEDFDRVEMVRGPGSALYGANAFSGVLNITTPPARELTGTKITLSGGTVLSPIDNDRQGGSGPSWRADLRHAGTFGRGRFGYRLNLGYQRSATFTRARTSYDGADLQREYAGATDSTVPNQDEPGGGNRELRPLAGQTIDPATGAAVGAPDPLENLFGSGRFDYYLRNGSILTADFGIAQSKNEVAVTGLGRVQLQQSLRPWTRLAWTADNYSLMAWYSGRTTPDTQVTLASGRGFLEYSAIWHAEGQYNRGFFADRGRVVVGGSFRNYQVDTRNTLMAPEDDNRSDNYYSLYGQLEYRLLPSVRLVGATRWDRGDLFASQFSPKAGVVYSPSEDHAVRLTFNHAFQTPNYSEFFLFAPAGPPSTVPARVEGGLEQLFTAMNTTFGSAVADLGLPNTLPWNFDSLTVPLALGNDSLQVETVNTWELGYKGTLARRVFLSVDLYLSELKNFVTDLLPCVNPQYPCYSLRDQGTDVPKNLDDLEARINQFEAGGTISSAQAQAIRAQIAQLRTGYNALEANLQPFLATGPGGVRTAVVSYANAGRVIEYGADVGLGVSLTDEVRLDAHYAFIEVKVREFQQGDELVPNTPKHRGGVTLSYRGRRGLDASASLNLTSGFRWLAGVYGGWVPARQTVDASVGYLVNNQVRLFAVGTNVLNQRRYQLFGGSIVGARYLGGVTVTF